MEQSKLLNSEELSKLLTSEELAEFLQVSQRHIRRLTQANVIPSIRVSERVIRYDLSAVINHLNATGASSPPRGSKLDKLVPQETQSMETTNCAT